MNEFLLQLMTGVVADDAVVKVYDHRDTEGNCVILLHHNIPVMLKDADADSYRNWSSGLTSEPEPRNIPVWH